MVNSNKTSKLCFWEDDGERSTSRYIFNPRSMSRVLLPDLQLSTRCTSKQTPMFTKFNPRQNRSCLFVFQMFYGFNSILVEKPEQTYFIFILYNRFYSLSLDLKYCFGNTMDRVRKRVNYVFEKTMENVSQTSKLRFWKNYGKC